MRSKSNQINDESNPVNEKPRKKRSQWTKEENTMYKF
jgi:hypothetical protein